MYQASEGCQCEKSTSKFQTTYTLRIKSSLILKQSHTKTSFPRVYCKRTASKLLYVAKGLKYQVDYQDDVLQFSTLEFTKTLRECRSFKFVNLSRGDRCAKAM